MTTIRPARTVNQNLSLQAYTAARSYTPSEVINMEKGLSQVMPTIIKSNGTPLWKLLADPQKYAALWSSITGTAAAIGTDVVAHMATSADSWFHPSALIAGLGAGGLGAAYGYVKQVQANENILDFTRLSQVENPSIRVFKADLSNLLTSTSRQPLTREALQNLSRLI